MHSNKVIPNHNKLLSLLGKPKNREDQLTSLISRQMSFAVIPWEFPDTKKQGQLDIWTSGVSSEAMAKVTGGCLFAVLNN